MLTYMFPGQGSQFVGMGKELFDAYRDMTEIADEILGYSIRELCLEDAEGHINLTQYSQPALYTVSAMMYRRKLEETGILPDYVAGHSLGEYNALLAAEVFDYADGLRLVKKRGELMGKARDGGMAAVIGLTAEQIADVIQENHLDAVDMANYNTPMQTVISGTVSDIERIAPIFEKLGARYVPLKVSAAFHSRYMKSAMEAFREYLDGVELKVPKIKVMSNVTARPYRSGEMKEILAKQIATSVKWCQSVQFLMGRSEEMQFVQIGPGNVLNGMIRKILKEAKPIYDEEPVEEAPAAQEAVSVKAEQPAAPITDTKPQLQKTLGNPEWMARYQVQQPCLIGAMQMGISSSHMVNALAEAGMLGFLGTAGLPMEKVREEVQKLHANGGVGVTHTPRDAQRETDVIAACLEHSVRVIEVSGFIKVTEPLVWYRLAGLSADASQNVRIQNRIILKASRPEVIKAFLEPASEKIVTALLEKGSITAQQAALAKQIPMADDICALADCGASTDMAAAMVVLPSVMRLRDEMCSLYHYKNPVYVGLAGGIGTPEAAAAAFLMQADFVETGSVNQCTVEAATSDTVKDMLQQADIQDTEYVPNEVFEFGGKVQVLKKGSLFFARLNKLYETYRQCESLNDVSSKLKEQFQNRYLHKDFQQVYEIVKNDCTKAEAARMLSDEKYKMAMIFGWYSRYGFQLALEGDQSNAVDFHINCSAAMGAWNRFVKGTPLENWRNRHVAEINQMLMKEALSLTEKYLQSFKGEG